MYTLNTTEVHAICYSAHYLGFDVWNQSVTGDVAITVRAAAGGADTTPCVLITYDKDDSI